MSSDSLGDGPGGDTTTRTVSLSQVKLVAALPGTAPPNFGELISNIVNKPYHSRLAISGTHAPYSRVRVDSTGARKEDRRLMA